MRAPARQYRVRRYPKCCAYFVISLDPAKTAKERFTTVAAFGSKEKAERLAQQLRKAA